MSSHANPRSICRAIRRVIIPHLLPSHTQKRQPRTCHSPVGRRPLCGLFPAHNSNPHQATGCGASMPPFLSKNAGFTLAPAFGKTPTTPTCHIACVTNCCSPRHTLRPRTAFARRIHIIKQTPPLRRVQPRHIRLQPRPKRIRQRRHTHGPATTPHKCPSSKPFPNSQSPAPTPGPDSSHPKPTTHTSPAPSPHPQGACSSNCP